MVTRVNCSLGQEIGRVIRTAARLIGGFPRTGHVSAYMLDVFHWLPFHHRLIFRLAALV